MQRQLIVNADDLGLAPGVTRGILKLARLGTVTSASALSNLPGSVDALRAAAAYGLDVGVHLTLSTGAPLTPPRDVPGLVGPDGRFLSAGVVTRRLMRGRAHVDVVAREWSAQIERALDQGLRPSHLDSHCHLHAYPPLYRLTVLLAHRYGIRGVRRAYTGFIYQTPLLSSMRPRLRPWFASGRRAPAQPEYFSVLTAMKPGRTARPLQAWLRALPRGVTELVCHPGYVDDELRSIDPLTVSRERELLLLSRPFFRETLQCEGIQLISWRELERRQ